MPKNVINFKELIKTPTDPYVDNWEPWDWEPWDDNGPSGLDEPIDDDMCDDPDCEYCNRVHGIRRAVYDKTLIIIKPDAIRRKIVSKVFKRLEATGLTLVWMELKTLSKGAAEDLYKEHGFEDFYEDLIEFITSGPCIVMVWQGENAAQIMRNIIGNKHPSESPPNTIRGACGGEYPETVIHGSDPWSAKREVGIFFEI